MGRLIIPVDLTVYSLDFNNPKDAFQNFRTNHYHDPSYGFYLEKTLGRYGIEELAEAGKREKLLFALKQGNLAPVTVVKGDSAWKRFPAMEILTFIMKKARGKSGSSLIRRCPRRRSTPCPAARPGIKTLL